MFYSCSEHRSDLENTMGRAVPLPVDDVHLKHLEGKLGIVDDGCHAEMIVLWGAVLPSA